MKQNLSIVAAIILLAFVPFITHAQGTEGHGDGSGGVGGGNAGGAAGDGGGLVGEGYLGGQQTDFTQDGFGINANPASGEGGGGAPSNPQLAPVSGGAAQCLSSNQVRLSWNRVSGADEYPVRIRPVVASNGGERPRDDIFDPTTNVTYNSIVPGAEYSWWVHAKYSGTWDGNSVSYPPNFSCRFPAPSMSHTCNANGTVQLSWSSVSGADLYPVRISDANGANERTDDTVTGTSKTFSIELGKAYQWWVHAMRDGNWDGASLQNKTPFSCRMPAPTMSHTCNGDGTVTVSWGGVSGADSYPLRIQPVGGSETALTKSGSSRSHTFSIDYDRDYQWWVHAWRDSNWAGASIQNKRPINCPSPNPTASISGTGCTISAGNSSCSGSLTWSIDPDGDTRNPNVYNDTTDTQFSNNAARTNQSVTLPHGTTNFDARLGSETLESVNLTASCAGGSSWNGSACATPPPLPTITANGSGNNQSITEGETVLVAWDNNGHQGNCTLTPGVMGDGNSPDSSNQTPPVGTTEYRISCTDTNDVYTGANTVSDSVLVTASARPAPPTPTLSASPNPIDSGNSTTLDWDPRDAGSATNCQLRIHPTNQVVSVANVTADSSTSRTLTQTTSYKYRCQYDDAVYNTTAWRESSVVTVTVDRPGCTIPGQFNYDSNATRNDGSCVPVIFGCTDATANNHNSSANTDDGSCTYGQAISVDVDASRIGSSVFYDNTLNITAGQQARVRWNAPNADTCTATAGPGLSTGGSTSNTDTTVTEPAAGNSTVFTVSCSNDTFSDSDSVTIVTAASVPRCGNSSANNYDSSIVSPEVRDDSVCVFPNPSASISGNGCTISAGNSSCTGRLTWSINPDGDSRSPNVYNDTTNTQFSSSQTGTNVAVTLSRGSTNFDARLGSQAYDWVNLVASCANGSAWNGSQCQTVVVCAPNQGNSCTSSANSCGMTNPGTIQCDGSCSATTPSNNLCQGPAPQPTISASPNPIERGESTTISWRRYGHTGSCSLSPNIGNASSDGSASVSPTANTMYRIRCADTQNDYSGNYYTPYGQVIVAVNDPAIAGCTDASAYNYNPSATVNDGSCVPVIFGCTDATANNHNSSANTDDGSCTYGQAISVDVDASRIGSSVFYDNTLNITAGQQARVRWNAPNADTCTATAGPGLSTGGSTSNTDTTVTEPAAGNSTVFTVSCLNDTFSDSDSVTIVTAATPQCSDGIDNDSDGFTDYDSGNGDPGCSSDSDTSESPQHCNNPSATNYRSAGACTFAAANPTISMNDSGCVMGEGDSACDVTIGYQVTPDGETGDITAELVGSTPSYTPITTTNDGAGTKNLSETFTLSGEQSFVPFTVSIQGSISEQVFVSSSCDSTQGLSWDGTACTSGSGNGGTVSITDDVLDEDNPDPSIVVTTDTPNSCDLYWQAVGAAAPTSNAVGGTGETFGATSDLAIDRTTDLWLECGAGEVPDTRITLYVVAPIDLDASNNFVRKNREFTLTWTNDVPADIRSGMSCSLTPSSALDSGNNYNQSGQDTEVVLTFEQTFVYECTFSQAYFVDRDDNRRPVNTVNVTERILVQPSFNET